MISIHLFQINAVGGPLIFRSFFLHLYKVCRPCWFHANSATKEVNICSFWILSNRKYILIAFGWNIITTKINNYSNFFHQWKLSFCTKAIISFLLLSTMYSTCSLKLKLLYIIIPKYLVLSTCSNIFPSV